MSKVIYTAIIGGYDELVEPDYKPEGWDFVCFTDRELESDIWEIRKTLPLYTDNTRTARKHKLLAHRLFPNHEYSLWIDGNIKVRDDVNELLGHLDGCNYATYDHLQNPLDPRGCIYDEGSTILQLGIKNGGNYKDNPDLIKRQMERYVKEGYPKNNGLVVQMEVLRRHNETDVVDSMEDQWGELKYNSKREQLSFNYIAWKNDLKFSYIQGDSRDNKYFLNMGKHKGKKMKKVFLDLGANTGQSVDYFREVYDTHKEFEIHCFEPTPSLYHNFANKNVILHKCAVWIEDGEIDFSVRSSLGSTLYESKTTGGRGTTITIESIDISKFIKDNFDIEDYLIVKMDIEGAEFKVIDKLAKDGTLEYIDKINVEYHAGKVPDFTAEDVNRCKYLLEDSGVDIIEWKRF